MRLCFSFGRLLSFNAAVAVCEPCCMLHPTLLWMRRTYHTIAHKHLMKINNNIECAAVASGGEYVVLISTLRRKCRTVYFFLVFLFEPLFLFIFQSHLLLLFSSVCFSLRIFFVSFIQYSQRSKLCWHAVCWWCTRQFLWLETHFFVVRKLRVYFNHMVISN